MNRKSKGLLLCVVFIAFFSPCQSQMVQQPGWPKITKEAKPWSRWWWMGGGVDTTNLKKAMKTYSDAGLGGLEITSIYGARGHENRFVEFMSPDWTKYLEYTLHEGKKLDLGIDLAMASGWPFGGPWVTPDDACKFMAVKPFPILKEGERLDEKVTMRQTPLLRTVNRKDLDITRLAYPIGANRDSLQNWAIDQVRYSRPMPLQAVMAYSDKGNILNLTAKVGADGLLDWTAPEGRWKLFAVFSGWHGKMVERAGPGGAGDVIDHFSERATTNYLQYFTETLNGRDISWLRAYFNDSYEVDDALGEANYTPLLFDEFKKRRGYDLREYLPALLGSDSDEYNRRVLCDYRETISDLLIDNYTRPWHDWAQKGNKIIRNQAHGSPANILDLYAIADIPETEGDDIVKLKAASSAAHVTGKKLASSESATWLKDHFEASLADVKKAVDLFLLAGINHVFYHGTTFSPEEVSWPGWMFYASVHFGPTNTFWNDFGTLNTYIARSQSFLQWGKPDNDLLLYYPIADEYAVRGNSLLAHFDGMAKNSTMRAAATYLHGNGYAFDFISDRQIAKLETRSGKILTGGNQYQAILMPSSKLMPIETFAKALELAKDGATVLMEGLPESVPGLTELPVRLAALQALKKSLGVEKSGVSVRRVKIGKGQVLIGNMRDILSQAKVRHEIMTDHGLQCIRRTDGSTTVYFIANRGDKPFDAMASLGTKVGSAVLYNPMNGVYGRATTVTDNKFGAVYLQLAPGESCIVQVFPEKVTVSEYAYWKADGNAKTLESAWALTFTKGGPNLPASVKQDTPAPWSVMEGADYKAFSGTAVYKTNFAKPTGNALAYRLDLGKVAHSARVSLNGKELAVLICPPFVVDIPASDLKTENTLEVAVTNLMGNRIADMEKKGQPYKIFYNINFPAHDAANRGSDGLFTTLNWKPQLSGLVGPVTLVPLKPVEK